MTGETAIIITFPEGWSAGQVLVRLPDHIDPESVQVDFRAEERGVWTPSGFFDGSVEVRHQ